MQKVPNKRGYPCSLGMALRTKFCGFFFSVIQISRRRETTRKTKRAEHKTEQERKHDTNHRSSRVNMYPNKINSHCFLNTNRELPWSKAVTTLDSHSPLPQFMSIFIIIPRNSFVAHWADLRACQLDIPSAHYVV